MLDIRKTQTENYVEGEGILTELKIDEGTSKKGNDYIRLNASIKVDQEINGKFVENVIDCRMFSMKLKSDGSVNSNYDRIASYKDKLIPLASVENPKDASRVKFTGSLAENVYVSRSTGLLMDKNFEVDGKFINVVSNASNAKEDSAKFTLRNAIVGKNPTRETDKEGNETGRVKIDIIIIGWKGKANVLQFVTNTPEAANFVEQNWSKGDSVNLTGVINCGSTVETYYEEQDFGEPIERNRTIRRRELVLCGASRPLDEKKSYDSNEIKEVLLERTAANDNLIAESKKKPAPTPKPASAPTAGGSEDFDW